MAVSLQPDPTQAGLNAFCSRAFANEFLLERRLFGTTWEACPNKDAAIMWATRELDRLLWIGSPAVDGQRHAWPRQGIANVDTDEIPEQVQEACAELAFYLAQADRSAPSAQEALQEVKVDVITVKFRESPTGRELTSEMPDSVMGLVRPFLRGGSMGTVNRMAVR